MSVGNRTDKHLIYCTYEDLDLWGEARWVTECTCGWKSRPGSSPGVVLGLWRRHIVLAGRGQPKKRS